MALNATITQEITAVSGQADEISTSSGQVRQSSEELQKMSVKLNDIVARFQVADA